MAKLGKDMPFPNIDGGARDWRAEFAKEEAALEHIRSTHDVVKFGVGDGYAMYVVESYSPPVLRWIPFGDCWQIPTAHMRGLTAKNLRGLVERDRAISELFGHSRTEKA